MRVIHLTRGKVTKVDDADYDVLNAHKWLALYTGKTFYAARAIRCKESGKNQWVLMHRVIMSAEAGMQVDHKDGDPLNNVRSNLRLATQSQQNYNQRTRQDNKSGVKGLYYHTRSKQWLAQIKGPDGKRRSKGFKRFEDAVLWLKEQREVLHGEFAKD